MKNLLKIVPNLCLSVSICGYLQNPGTVRFCLRLLLGMIVLVLFNGPSQAGAAPLYGDANGDGRVNIEDIQSITNQTGNVLRPDLADVNGDGRVDDVDAMFVRQYLAGTITSLPVDPVTGQPIAPSPVTPSGQLSDSLLGTFNGACMILNSNSPKGVGNETPDSAVILEGHYISIKIYGDYKTIKYFTPVIPAPRPLDTPPRDNSMEPRKTILEDLIKRN